MGNQRRFALIGRGFGSDNFDEYAQDLVGALFVDSSEINFTYTDATPSITAALINASIVFARLQNFDALSVLGRSANTSGVGDEIAAAADGDVLNRNGTSLVFGQTLTGALKFSNATTAIELESATPRLLFDESDAAADSRNWGIDVQGAVMRFRAWNDALNSSETFWEIARTGTNIDGFTLSADVCAFTGFILFSSGNAQFRGTSVNSLQMVCTGAATDEQVWELRSLSGGAFVLDTVNDAGSVTVEAIRLERTGTTVDEIQLDATSLDLNAALDLGGSAGTASQSIVMSAGAAATPSWLTAGTNDRLLRQTGGVLNFGQLTAGMFPNTVVPDAALSSNVPLLNAANIFTATQSLTGASSFLGIGTSAPQRLIHAVINNSAAFTICALENTDTTDNNGFVVSFRGTTTGAGGAAFTELGGFRTQFTTHDHATRASNFSIFTSGAGAIAETARFDTAEIELNATAFDFNGTFDVDGGNHDISTSGTLTISGTGETLATFVDDGAVTLYHNNTARLATSATGVDVTGILTATAQVRTGVYTVGTLPGGTQGDRALVTDALTPVFGAAVAAGGAAIVPVYYTGAAWFVG